MACKCRISLCTCYQREDANAASLEDNGSLPGMSKYTVECGRGSGEGCSICSEGCFLYGAADCIDPFLAVRNEL